MQYEQRAHALPHAHVHTMWVGVEVSVSRHTYRHTSRHNKGIVIGTKGHCRCNDACNAGVQWCGAHLTCKKKTKHMLAHTNALVSTISMAISDDKRPQQQHCCSLRFTDFSLPIFQMWWCIYLTLCVCVRVFVLNFD